MLYMIDAINTYTNIRFKEYWFGSQKTLKRVQFLLNECNYENYRIYEIVSIYKLPFSLKNLKKCLTN
jgi:hypothetical protein